MKILNFPYMISGVVSHTKSISKSWFERFKKHVNQKAQFFKPQKLKKKIANCNFFFNSKCSVMSAIFTLEDYTLGFLFIVEPW